MANSKKFKFNLFNNTEDKEGNEPDFRGNGQLPKSVVGEIVNWFKESSGAEEITMEIAGWTNQDKNGKDYQTCEVQIARKQRESYKPRTDEPPF